MNLYDELVDEGDEPDITTVFLKIDGYPPLVLRPLRKSLLVYSGINRLSKCSIAALRELPIRIPDPVTPSPVDGGPVRLCKPFCMVKFPRLLRGGKRTCILMRSSFKSYSLSCGHLSTSTTSKTVSLPLLVSLILTLRSTALRTTISDSVSTPSSRLPPWVGTGEHLTPSAKGDVEGLRKVCLQDKSHERKLAERGIDNDVLLALVDHLRKDTDYSLPVSQIVNSQDCGFLFTSVQKRYIYVDSRYGPENLKPFVDRKNNIFGECVICLTSRVLFSTSPLVIVTVNLV